MSKKGITLRQTFIDCGFDIDIIGFERIKAAYGNWKKIDNEDKEVYVNSRHLDTDRKRTPFVI